MQAKPNTKYAVINNNIVSNIFDNTIMKQWSENDIFVVEIPKDIQEHIKIGTKYENNEFIIIKPNIKQIQKDRFYAVIEAGCVADIITPHFSEYDSNIMHLALIPQELEEFIAIDTPYVENEFILDINKCKNIKMQNITKSYESSINSALQEEVPITEMLTWNMQEAEARAYLQSKDKAQAPTIKLMAEAQNRDLEEFANKILQKSEQFRAAAGKLIGYKQNLIKEVENAQSIEELSAIKFNLFYLNLELG